MVKWTPEEKAQGVTPLGYPGKAFPGGEGELIHVGGTPGISKDKGDNREEPESGESKTFTGLSGDFDGPSAKAKGGALTKRGL